MRALNSRCAVESLEARRLFDTTVPIVDQATIVRFVEPDGTRATLKSLGATGSLEFIGDVVPMQKGRTVTLQGLTALRSINAAPAAAGTAIRSLTLSAKGGNGTVDLQHASISGSIGLFGGKSAVLGGQLDVQGRCDRLLLDSAADGSSITINAVDEIRIRSDCFSSIQLGTSGVVDFINRIHVGGRVSDVWDVNIPIQSIYGGEFDEEWEGDFEDVGSFTCRGDFLGDVDARSFRGVYVGGRMLGANVGLLDPLGSDDDYALGVLSVKGPMDGVVISSIRSIGTIRTACIENSLIFVGINAEGLSGENRIPAAPQNFERNSRIDSITISARSPLGFSDSVLAAKSFGNLQLGRVFTTNGGHPFGIGTTMADSVSGTFFGSGSDMRFRFTGLGSNMDFGSQAAAQGLQTGDFRMMFPN